MQDKYDAYPIRPLFFLLLTTKQSKRAFSRRCHYYHRRGSRNSYQCILDEFQFMVSLYAGVFHPDHRCTDGSNRAGDTRARKGEDTYGFWGQAEQGQLGSKSHRRGNNNRDCAPSNSRFQRLDALHLDGYQYHTDTLRVLCRYR